MTTLATGDGTHGTIALEDDTLYKLHQHCAGQLADACAKELGYGVRCLTEAEGQFLLRCSSLDGFRAGVHGARDGWLGHAHGLTTLTEQGSKGQTGRAALWLIAGGASQGTATIRATADGA
jgi:hypothetical protein